MQGIATLVVNEFGGGGIGDIVAFDSCPELWLQEQTRFDEANGILKSILEDNNRDECCGRGCQEKNDASFQLFWNCREAHE